MLPPARFTRCHACRAVMNKAWSKCIACGAPPQGREHPVPDRGDGDFDEAAAITQDGCDISREWSELVVQMRRANPPGCAFWSSWYSTMRTCS